MDEGDAGLLLQGVHVLHDAALGLAHIDDHIRRGGQQRLQIHLTLAAVELSQQRQVVVLRIQKLSGALIPRIGDAHQLVGRHREHHDLRQRAGDGDLLHVRRYRDLAAAGIGKHTGGGLVTGILAIAVIRLRLGAAGKQRYGHDQRQQQRYPFFSIHFRSPPDFSYLYSGFTPVFLPVLLCFAAFSECSMHQIAVFPPGGGLAAATGRRRRPLPPISPGEAPL